MRSTLKGKILGGLSGQISALKKAIELCYVEHDHGSRELLEKILKDEETHLDWLETQLHMIDELGLKHYLVQQM